MKTIFFLKNHAVLNKISFMKNLKVLYGTCSRVDSSLHNFFSRVVLYKVVLYKKNCVYMDTCSFIILSK